MSYYFEDPTQAAALKAEALSWLGTPFREYYEQQIAAIRAEWAILDPTFVVDVKGPGGGIDCIGLAEEIYSRINAQDEFIFPRTPADYESSQLGDKVLTWLRGEEDDDQSRLLGMILDEITIPDPPIPDDFFLPGDLLVMKHGSLFHMPIIIDTEWHFVNALPRLGVVEGTIQDFTFKQYLVAVFRLKAVPAMTDAARLALATPTPLGYRVMVTDLTPPRIQKLSISDPSVEGHWIDI